VVVTGGEVQGQERVQELTRVLRNHVSRLGWSEWWSSMGTRGGGGGVDGDDGAPAIDVGKGPAHESQ
jgi:hypothetical protein